MKHKLTSIEVINAIMDLFTKEEIDFLNSLPQYDFKNQIIKYYSNSKPVYTLEASIEFTRRVIDFVRPNFKCLTTALVLLYFFDTRLFKK